MANLDRRGFLGLGAAVAAVGLLDTTLAGCGGSSSGGTKTTANSLKLSGADLVAAAKKEGQVRAYILDQGLADQLSKGFKKAYPWADVQTIVGSQTDLRNRAITESVSGAQTADVLTLSNAQRSALMKDKIVQAVSLDNEKDFDSSVLDPQHYAHPLYQYVVVYAVNTKLLKSAPTTMEDLADPSLKGMIAFDAPQNASTAATFLVGKREEWGGTKWNQWLQGLKANKILVTSDASAALTDVQSGERAISLSSSQDAFALPKGSPVKPMFYDKLVPVIQYAWLTAKGKNPACGKLFLDWLMSADGQRAVAASGRAPVLDIDTPVSLSKTLPAGTSIMPATELNSFFTDPTPALDKLNKLWPA